MTLFILQVGVLLLTVLLWWRARQDIASRVSGLPPAAEWERLRQTVEQLTADLERRAVVAEQRVSAAEQSLEARLRAGEGPHLPSEGSPHPPAPFPVPTGEGEQDKGNSYQPFPRSDGGEVPKAEKGPLASEGLPAAYAAAESLIAEGAHDPQMIARETGIGRGEAELLLSLRSRRP